MKKYKFSMCVCALTILFFSMTTAYADEFRVCYDQSNYKDNDKDKDKDNGKDKKVLVFWWHYISATDTLKTKLGIPEAKTIQYGFIKGMYSVHKSSKKEWSVTYNDNDANWILQFGKGCRLQLICILKKAPVATPSSSGETALTEFFVEAGKEEVADARDQKSISDSFLANLGKLSETCKWH